jgi:membrane protein
MKTILAVFARAYKKFNDDRCPLLASALVNAAIFSLFPLLLGILSISLFILGSSNAIIDRVLPVLKQAVPIGLEDILRNIRAIKQTSIIMAVVGLLGFLWGSASIFGAIESSLNVIWKAPKDRPFFKKSLIIIGWAFLSWVLLIASFGIAIWTNALGLKGFMRFFPLISSIMSIGIFCLIYWFFPNLKVRWREALAGAVFTGIFWELAKDLFSLYVTRVVDYSRIFGSLTAIIILLLWLYYSAYIFLFGAELGYAYSEKAGKNEMPNEKF